MPQNPFGAKPPMGVIFNTSMTRPDAALALAEIYGFESRREARMGSVCVVGSGLKTAIFCDLTARFYQTGPLRNGNQALAVGLAAVDPLPPDPPMVLPAVDRKDEKGGPRYPRTVNKLHDTSLAEAVLRNGVIFNAEAAIVLSAPATYLARSLDLPGTKDLYKQRVKRLIIVDDGSPQRDVAALRRVISEWPAPVFYCGPEVGRSLRFPGEAIEKDFEWAPAHPVVDAYRAFQPMPYDAAAYDVAAIHYAVHPDSGFFQVSEAGALTVSGSGEMRFSAGGGNVRQLVVVDAKKAEAIAAFVAVTSAKPVVPQPRFRRGDANAPDTNGGKPPAAPGTVVKKQNQ